MSKEELEKENVSQETEESEDLNLSDSDHDESDNDEESSGSEYEEIDVTDNPLYQVLSAFFETEDGENICDILKDLGDAVRENTKMLNKVLKK